MDDKTIFSDLDIFGYDSQYVQNEAVQTETWHRYQTTHVLNHKPVLTGTTTGTVYVGTTAIYTFVEKMTGDIEFTPIGKPQYDITGGTIACDTAQIALHWQSAPSALSLIVSYEYSTECQAPKPKKAPEFKIPTFETFFTSTELAEIARTAGTTCMWDFNSALGDTIMEKYESLYVKAIELNNILINKGAAGYFWIVTSAEIASIFETATAGFCPVSEKEYLKGVTYNPVGGVMPQGIPAIYCCGTINSKWRIYKDTEMPSNMLLMGCNDTREDKSHYAKMTVVNFII